jgi:hypothetical protein
MNLIDKYAYTVVRWLPAKARAEVEADLRANIMDMLPEEYSEADVERALYDLGNPAALAAEYRKSGEGKSVLIGPALYGNYIYVLKLVGIIVACIIPFVAIIAAATDDSLITAGEIMLAALGQMWIIGITAAAHVFAWVTAFFAVLERVAKPEAVQWPYTGKKWTVKDLVEPTDDGKNRISRVETAFSLGFTVILTAALVFFPHIIGINISADGSREIIPFINIEALAAFIPFIIIAALIGIFVDIMSLIFGKWNKMLFITNVVYTAAVIPLAGFMLFDSSLRNNEFAARFKELAEITPYTYDTIWQWIAIIAMTSIVVFCIWGVVSSYRKMKR